MPWGFAALAAFLDWIAHGLVNPSIPARIFICFLILVCVALAVVIALQWDSLRKSRNPQKERQAEPEKAQPLGPDELPAITDQEGGNQTEDTGNNQKPARRRRFNWKPDAVAAFTGLLTFVTGVQVWAFIQSERAFISPASMTFRPPVAPEKIAVFDMKIGNSGNSTANIKHHVYNVAEALPETPAYPDWGDITLSPVVGGGSIQFQIKVGPIPDGAFKFLSGNAPFFIYGRIDYEDEFSVIAYKHSGWCFSFDPKGNPNVSRYAALSACNRSNSP